MAEELKREITIENGIATWHIHTEGDIQGTYNGKFRFRCFLTPLQKIAANREYRELLGAQITMAGEHESFLAYCITQLKQRIVEAPPFWTTNGTGTIIAGDVADEIVLQEVLDAAIAAEKQYIEEMKARKIEAIERSKKAAEKILAQPSTKHLDE